MHPTNNKSQHQDQIWSYVTKEKEINLQMYQIIYDLGFVASDKFPKELNYGQPYIFHRDGTYISIRFVDSVFMTDPDAWDRPAPSMVITDNILLKPINGTLISGLPEHWGVYHQAFNYKHSDAVKAYNCFMNRISGDRSLVFYELIRRKILEHGLVSFNCWRPGQSADHSLKNYNQEFIDTDLYRYQTEHDQGSKLIPYHGLDLYQDNIELAILDSRVSLILETFISDTHIVFSEKIFRCLQLPRPWVLYCSPQSVHWLRHYGFDVLDDYVDHSYDNITQHFDRLLSIVDQLETFIDCKYTEQDYRRFDQAAKHNRALLSEFEQRWPEKFNNILQEIKKL